MNLEEIQCWLPPEQYSDLVSLLVKHIGLTRTRADYFMRLWIYLLVKQQRQYQPDLQPPLKQLKSLEISVICTHQEAAELFYSESDRGSDRSAGMMLDKLASLGLIKKHFDGNTTSVEIPAIPVLLEPPEIPQSITLKPDAFDPRSDAIPVANLLATYYNWMDETPCSVPRAARIAKLLRIWGNTYRTGMRVLRRCDNQNPVGFYVIYPVASESDIYFFSPPNRNLSIGWIEDCDPFQMANPGDLNCISCFVRGWFIEPQYAEEYQLIFLQDAQETLLKIQQDFPNTQDLYAILIHPSFERLVSFLGFLRLNQDPQSSLTWLYLPLDRFVQLNLNQSNQAARKLLG
ncbi:MAG: hypothetical protein WBA13_06065 [Microcoleaceae cyanobacterium]